MRSPMSRSNVDLPQPDGPIRETNSPPPMERSMSSSARTPPARSPNVLPTPARRTAGVEPTAGVEAAAGSREAGEGLGSVTGAPFVVVESGAGRRPVAIPGDEAFCQADEADEPEAQDRAHDDRRPQAFRSGRVVLVVVEEGGSQPIGDPGWQLAD